MNQDEGHLAPEPPELLPEIQEEVDRLPERYRSPIVLCYLEGRTHEEAASQLRIPVGTVKIRLERGRKRLGDALMKRGVVLSAGLAWALGRTTADLTPNLHQAAPHADELPHEKRAGAAGEKRDDQGWVELFNGKDLTGWKTHPRDKAKWQVRDGLLIGSGGTGHLFSERGDYQNFRFRVEAMINDHGNSGQYFRTRFEPGFPHAAQPGCKLAGLVPAQFIDVVRSRFRSL